MNNKEVEEEPWKRGKKGMNNKEGKEEPLKRGKNGLNNKEGKKETWKRGKVKPEQRKIEMATAVEKETPRKNLANFFYDLQLLPSNPCPGHLDPALWIQGIQSKQCNPVQQHHLGLEIGPDL